MRMDAMRWSNLDVDEAGVDQPGAKLSSVSAPAMQPV